MGQVSDEAREGFEQLSQQIDTISQKTYRTVWAVCAVFLVVTAGIIVAALLLIPPTSIAQIQQGLVPSGAGETDFLKITVPLFVVGFGFVLGMLGLKRLEQFDSEIDDLRSSLSRSLLEERKFLNDDRKITRDDIHTRIEEIRRDIRSLVNHYSSAFLSERQEHVEKFWSERQGLIERFLSERQGAIQKIVEEAEERARETIQRVQTELKPYEWLSEKKVQVMNISGIYTIGIAHQRVESLYHDDKPEVALEIVHYCLKNHLPGSYADFHNLGSELARNQQNTLAAQITDIGLEAYPDSVDLLSDGIKWHSETGKTAQAQELYRRLRDIDFRKWNWRAFVFAGDFLELTGQIDEAMEVYEQFRKQLPDDERGYSQPGIYYRQLGKHTEAAAILQEGMNACKRCPQVAFSLSEIYLETGEYEKAILAADRGIESNADEQPSVNQASMVWNRALAEDSLLHRYFSEGNKRSADDEVLALARSAVIDYRTALDMTDSIALFHFRGQQRLNLLRALLLRNGASQEQLRAVFTRDELGEWGQFSAIEQFVKKTVAEAEAPNKESE